MDFDVIVIGAGGGGLTAALAARRNGAKTLVISKTQSGFATCTAYAGGGFTLACGNVTVEEHRNNTLKVGRGINNPDLVDILSTEGEAALRELESLGMTIKLYDDGHASVRRSAPTPIMGGAGMTAELTQIAKNLGVEFMENTVVTELLVGHAGVEGVDCISWDTGKAHRIGCSSVILATGGAGHIYERTDNPARVTGDGYVLALKAGLPLADMEFVQFYPLGWDEPGFAKWMIGLPMMDLARVTDSSGQEFLKKRLNELGLTDGYQANLFGRDVSARLVGQEHSRGGVFMHFEELAPEVWDSNRQLKEVRRFYPVGTTPWEYGPVRVSPIQHYFTGGVVINSDGETGIPGLFACGEVTAGVDGASRIGGNALTNIVTFGLRAGRAAASYKGSTASILSSTPSLPCWDGSNSPPEIRRAIQRIAQEGLGVVRHEAGIRVAVAQLEELGQKVSSVKATTARDRLLALELPGLWYSALSVGKAALNRTESRGVHFREDYPEETPTWQKSITVRLNNGTIQ